MTSLQACYLAWLAELRGDTMLRDRWIAIAEGWDIGEDLIRYANPRPICLPDRSDEVDF